MDAELCVTLAYFNAYPLDAAKQLETWPTEDIADVMGGFTAEDAAPVLEQFSSDQAASVLLLLPQDQAVAILAALPTHAAIGILRQFEPAVQGDLLALVDQTVGPSLRLSAAYPESTAASLADPRVVTLPPDIPVSAALERVKHDPRRATYYQYVVERDGVLVGLVTTKELVVADPTELVATIMKDQLETVSAEATEDELLQNPQWRLYHTLPVVDREQHFLGALRYRTLRQIEGRSTVQQTAGSLPDALLQMWEAYALTGLRVMTDLAQAVETTVIDAAPLLPQESETTDGTPSQTP
ncbi:MAG: CBS domain-containing protein [Nitrospirota bacterium]|nr:CBS domain-containing protein [Nitrospirota bacterium]